MKLISLMQLQIVAGSYRVCTIMLVVLFLSASTYARGYKEYSSKKYYQSKLPITVTGTVKDNKGEPLPGVSVKIKGTNTATSTDVNGVYRINLPTGNETLVFSFLGFKTLEVAANGRTVIDVALQESSKELTEVVVVGYAEQKRATVAGSIATIQTKEIEDIPASNLSTLLQGRLPGVSIGGVPSGRPGVNTTLTIRLNTSFNSAPALFVIDGFVATLQMGKRHSTA